MAPKKDKAIKVAEPQKESVSSKVRKKEEGKQPNKYQDLLTYVLFVIACCTATVALVVFSIFSQTLFTEFMSSVVLRRTKKERVMNAAKSLQSVGGSVVKVGHALFCTCNNARNPMDY